MKTFSKTPAKVTHEFTLIVEGLLLDEPTFSEHDDTAVLCRSRIYELRHEHSSYFVYEVQSYSDDVLGRFKIEIPRFQILFNNNKTQTIQL